MSVEVKIQLKNANKIRRFLHERPQETKTQLNRAIATTVREVERETKKRTPVDTGRLRSSIQSREYPSILEGEVGTDVVYAVVQHENLSFRHRVGEAKFLERAVQHLKSRIQGHFLKAMKNVIE